MSEENFVPRDFVYAGRRSLKGDKIGHSVYPIADDGKTLQAECLYVLKARFSAVIGGVYTGATFAETKSRGISEARYVRSWPDHEAKIEWEALDTAAATDAKWRRLESDAGKLSEIDALLLPLRERLTAMRKRGDYTGAHALENAIMMSLHKPPREGEHVAILGFRQEKNR